jgi:CBS-domain-containing membrane protein
VEKASRWAIDPRFLLRAWVGAALTLGVALLTEAGDSPLLLASLGGSCVILFGNPDSDMAQPRSLVGGHLIGTVSGLIFLNAFGTGWWVMAAAMASALVAMLLTDTIHSPAGADPLIVIAAHASWGFLWNPVAIGVAVLLVGALVANNLGAARRYPRRWR